MNPFTVLEIPSDASPEDIKAAYHRLAKRWHPDRFSGEEKASAEQKFRELAEAFSILKDPGKRLAILQQLPQAQQAQPAERPMETAQERSPEDWATMAKQAFDEGRVDQARALIHYAIRLDECKPKYHALLATILEREGGDPRAVVKALEATVRLAPKDVDSHIRLALLFQSLGMAARAQRHLKIAREITPNHPKLRQFASKGSKPPAPGAGGKVKGKSKAGAQPAAPGSLLDQLRDLWGRLTGKG